jgi:pimeloyl-ACP methyl ester carboxylesterase
MAKVKSTDGTTIAFDKQGDGPAAIFVYGAMSTRFDKQDLAKMLSHQFTVYGYDRRGRGDSGHTQPYAVEPEIEDILGFRPAPRPRNRGQNGRSQRAG